MVATANHTSVTTCSYLFPFGIPFPQNLPFAICRNVEWKRDAITFLLRKTAAVGGPLRVKTVAEYMEEFGRAATWAPLLRVASASGSTEPAELITKVLEEIFDWQAAAICWKNASERKEVPAKAIRTLRQWFEDPSCQSSKFILVPHPLLPSPICLACRVLYVKKTEYSMEILFPSILSKKAKYDSLIKVTSWSHPERVFSSTWVHCGKNDTRNCINGCERAS